jgi:hypothetical protein
MIAAKKNAVCFARKVDKKVDYTARVRSAVDIIAEENELIIWPGADFAEKAGESDAATVNVTNGESSHLEEIADRSGFRRGEMGRRFRRNVSGRRGGGVLSKTN